MIFRFESTADCVQTACPFVHTQRSTVDESIPHKHFKAILAAIGTEILMSAGPVTSPIQCLDLDVLWHIFNINADIIDDDTALETTLATSYVCHDWRSLLLNSTSIWAHVINLNHWMWNTVEGSRELIRRSGTALPWIKTNIPPRYSRTKRQIPDILDTHWDQIQKLDVTSYNLNDLKNHPPLRRPALHLELLRVRFVGHRGRPEIESASPSLFSGSAPLLRDLRWEGYGLNITGISWLRQVRCMELSSTLTVSAILRVLEVNNQPDKSPP